MPITVVIADDQAMVRQGFGALLGAQPDISVIGDAPDGKAAVAEVARLQPDVVLMDVRMPEMNGLQAAAEIMIAQGTGGRIVNIASQAAKSGFPHAQAYTASKHGLVGLARSAAVELGAFGITVNNVCPNHVTTGLGAWQNAHFAELQGVSVAEYLQRMAARIPLGRPGLPEDTAKAVAFLCSDEAVYITGESMNVSGGEETH